MSKFRKFWQVNCIPQIFTDFATALPKPCVDNEILNAGVKFNTLYHQITSHDCAAKVAYLLKDTRCLILKLRLNHRASKCYSQTTCASPILYNP